MIKVIWIPNIYENRKRQSIELDYAAEKTVRDYVIMSGFSWNKCRYILSGKKVKDDNEIPKDNDEIIVTPEVNHFLIPLLVTIGGGSLLWGAVQVVFWAATLAYGIYAMTAKPRKPNMGTSSIGGGIDENSPTYGWDGIQTVQDIGIPVPIVYGEHKVGGNIINAFIRYDGDYSYLNVLLSLCEGEIHSISDIKINDNPAENYDGISTDTRMGQNNQSAISNFEDSHNLYNVNVDLPKDDPYVYTTVDNDVEAIEIHLSCPGGLYSMSAEGGMSNASITYTVEYKLHTDPLYTNLGSTTFSDQTRSAVRKVFRIDGLAAGQYDIRVTKTSDESDTQTQRDMQWIQLDEIKTDNLAYPNTALLGIEALATNQLSGSMPNFSCIVKGRKVSAPVIMNGEVQVDWEDYYWDPDTSQYKLIEDDTVLTWDEETYAEQYSANPVWCMKDLLINTRYGLGEYMSSALLDDDQLLEMSQYCEELLDDGEGGYEKRFRLDVVIDGGGRALDIISQLCTVFRGLPFYSAGNINLRIDKPGTPVQLFTMGNIIKDSFAESWKSFKEIPNLVEIQYLNKANDYKQETLAYVDEAAITNGDPLRKKSVKLFTTSKSQAMREARYSLKLAKYIDKTVTFKAMIDAIACQAGDIISLSHDVLEIGESGRIISGSTTTSVKLDHSVTLLAATTYKLRIQFADDTIEEKTVSSPAGTYTTIQVVGDPFTSAPAEYDKYCLGTSSTVKEDYRIISMAKDVKFEIEITAVKYDENVYDDTEVSLPDDNLQIPSYIVPPVSDLQLYERIYTKDDGTIDSAIDVFFTPPSLANYDTANRYKGANVYMRESSDARWRFMGYTESDYIQITGHLIVGTTYYICVTSVPYEGNETSKSSAPADSLEIAGKTTAPSDVSNFAYDFTDQLLLTWDKISDADIAGYEIRKADSSWGVDNTDLVYRGTTNSFIYRPATRSPGALYIKAYNTSGVYSDTAGTVSPTNSAPGAPTSLSGLVFFNVAKLSWSDVADADIQYYEVYRSETDAWGGEEVLISKVAGTSKMVDARKPTGGNVSSAASGSVTDENLIGEDDDFCNGDIIECTTGDNAGEQKTITDFNGTTGEISISGTWSTTPSENDKFVIYDKSYFKVRAVDSYGVGTFSSSLAVVFETLTEDALGDETITARKLTTGELITLTAQIKDAIITAAKIADATITNAKIEDATIQSAKIVSLEGSKITAESITLSKLASEAIPPKTYYQDAEPDTGIREGDYWVDTDDDNKLYVYQSSAWVEVSASSASSGITTFRQEGVPTALSAGDLWIKTSTSQLYRATAEGDDEITAGEWELVDVAVATGWSHASDSTKIDGGDIYTGTVTAEKITVTQLDAIQANTGTLTVDEYVKAGDNVFIDGANEIFKVYSDTITIETGVNDKMDWLENDGSPHTYACTLDPDEYDPADLATELQTKMRAQGDDNTTVTWNSTTRKFTIANSTLSAFTLKWSSGTNTETTCGRAFGFDITADDSGSLTYAGDDQATLRVELGLLS